jgi:hypothetical protein
MRLLAGGMSDMNADIISFLIIGKLVKRSQSPTGRQRVPSADFAASRLDFRWRLSGKSVIDPPVPAKPQQHR